MMKRWAISMQFAILVSVASLIACSTTSRDLAKATRENSRQTGLCKSKQEGRLVAISNFRTACTWPSEDAGKACSDASECEGICEVLSTDGSTSHRGRCSALQAEQKSWLGNCGWQLVHGKPISNCVD